MLAETRPAASWTPSRKVGMSRVIRTRAIFPNRSLSVTAEHDPEVADLFNIRQ